MEHVSCPRCGSNITESGVIREDGPDHFCNEWRCTDCGTAWEQDYEVEYRPSGHRIIEESACD